MTVASARCSRYSSYERFFESGFLPPRPVLVPGRSELMPNRQRLTADPAEPEPLGSGSAGLGVRSQESGGGWGKLQSAVRHRAGGPHVDTEKNACEKTKKLSPGLIIDGKVQADSALEPSISEKKTSIKGSPVAGRANVLIFPNLDSGNIGYKLVHRLTGARAVGPLMLGLKKPCSDLSRGCSVDDIIDAVAATAVRGQS